jgi:hypothetical protein
VGMLMRTERRRKEMNLIEQCFELEDWEALRTQGPALNFIRSTTKYILDDFNRPSLLRQILTVEKVNGKE